VLVVTTLRLAVGLGRNHHLLACGQQRLNHPVIGIKRFVCNHDAGGRVGQQHIGPFKVAGLSGRQMNPGGVAQRIDGDMNLGAQATTAAPDRLRLFFWAPALC